MSSFFHQQAQIMMGKHIDSYPLLKINRLLDWQPVEQLLDRQKTRYIRDYRGKPLTEQEKQRNTQLSKVRYVVEQTFGTLHRKFGCKKARVLVYGTYWRKAI